MTNFSADSFLEALEPWSFTTGGRRYVAQPVSAPRVARFLHACTSAQPNEQHRQLKALLREAFPKRLSFLWRGDPVLEILAMEPRTRDATLKSFFASLGLTTLAPTSSEASTPPGAASSS